MDDDGTVHLQARLEGDDGTHRRRARDAGRRSGLLRGDLRRPARAPGRRDRGGRQPGRADSRCVERRAAPSQSSSLPSVSRSPRSSPPAPSRCLISRAAGNARPVTSQSGSYCVPKSGGTVRPCHRKTPRCLLPQRLGGQRRSVRADRRRPASWPSTTSTNWTGSKPHWLAPAYDLHLDGQLLAQRQAPLARGQAHL